MTVSGCKTANAPGAVFLGVWNPHTDRAGRGRKTSRGRGCWMGQGQGVPGREGQLGSLAEEMVRRVRERSLGSECAALSTVLKRPAGPLS